ncbi:MAG: FixH family protein [Chitinophagaceae bacterium]|jgi:hypothetical protein
MNWGYKILVVIVLFVLGMGTMVTIAMKQTNEMVDDQYYLKELKHQELIDASDNLNSNEGTVVVSQPLNFIKISFPEKVSENVSEGTIMFLRPSDKSKDRVIPLVIDSSGEQMISKSKFITGNYTMRIQWKNNGIAYYDEQPVFVK